MVLGNMGLEIAVFSVGLALASRLLQIRFGNKKHTNALQEGIKKKQEQLKELLKKDDQKSKAQAQTIQTEMMEDLNKVMNSSMKVMIISSALFLPALALMGFLYNGQNIAAPFPIPVFHRGTDFPFWVELSAKSNWFSWYFWWALIASFALTFIFKKMKIE